MPGPFHYHIRGYSQGKSIDDEGAAAGVGTDELILGIDSVRAYIPFIGGHPDLFINTGQFAKLLDIPVHGLVGQIWKCLIVFKGDILVLFQNGFGDIVQLDGDAVGRLDGSDFNMVSFDVAAAEVVGVGVPKAGEAAEEQHIPHRIQEGLLGRQLQRPDLFDFLLGQVNDTLLRLFEGRMEGFIAAVCVESFLGGPVQEPFKVEFLRPVTSSGSYSFLSPFFFRGVRRDFVSLR